MLNRGATDPGTTFSANTVRKAAADRTGRGLANMRTRALRLGAQLEIEPANPGTRVCLEFDQTPAAYPASTANAG